jgi:Spy/CpxP family protein refolding chaperone
MNKIPLPTAGIFPRQNEQEHAMRTNRMRTAKISALAVALSGAVVGLAGFGWHCHGHKFAKEMVDRHVSKVLDKLDATPDQRLKVTAIEDKLFADFKAMGQSHRAAFSQVIAQFGQDELSPAVLDTAFTAQQQSREKVHQDVRQAILDMHALLSPAQRQKLVQIIQEKQKEWGDGDGETGSTPSGTPSSAPSTTAQP